MGLGIFIAFLSRPLRMRHHHGFVRRLMVLFDHLPEWFVTHVVIERTQVIHLFVHDAIVYVNVSVGMIATIRIHGTI